MLHHYTNLLVHYGVLTILRMSFVIHSQGVQSSTAVGVDSFHISCKSVTSLVCPVRKYA